MRKTLNLAGAVLGVVALCLTSGWLQAGDSASVPVTVTVSVHSERGASVALAREDVLVYQQGSRRPVLSWRPAASVPLDLAIMVDDSLESQFGLQLDDLRNFIRALPSSTRVAIVYAQHGHATIAQPFTPDHEQAAKALRLPQGRVEAGSSIYLAVADLLKHWPEDSHHRRSVLLISDGLDLYRGLADSTPGINPDLQQAIEAAQRARVTMYTLFTNSAGRADRNAYLSANGQGSLEMLATATGGEAFFQGTETPLAFQPFLNRLRNELDGQYVLTFAAQTGKQPGYQPVRITTEQPGVKLIGPEQVYVPGS